MDRADSLEPETLIFPVLYNMFLCKFFPGGLKILQDYYPLKSLTQMRQRGELN